MYYYISWIRDLKELQYVTIRICVISVLLREFLE